MHRLPGTLCLLCVQVGLHGYEELQTGHRLRSGRLGSRKRDGTGRFVQTIEEVVEVDGGEIFSFFCSRTFLPQDLGLGLLYWAVSRQRQRNDCCTGQSPGNEVTVLLVSLQARGGGVGQIQAMLFKRGLGFGWRQWALVACGRGIR